MHRKEKMDILAPPSKWVFFCFKLHNFHKYDDLNLILNLTRASVHQHVGC